MRYFLFLFCLVPLLAGCHRASTTIEPCIVAPPHPKEIEREKRRGFELPENFSCSPFTPLNEEEAWEDWGKELRIGLAFADDFDLYRAITAFKRALLLLPPDKVARRLEIEYDVALAYYLGHKYVEVTHSIESTGLVCVDSSFPAYQDLLLILYDSYTQLGKETHAKHVFCLIEKNYPKIAEKLTLLSFVQCGNIEALEEVGATDPSRGYLGNLMCCYEKEAKSVKKAERLNMILPGAGYWYVGQRETAFTAFVVNALFIGAAAYFIEDGNIPAAAITLSLESGWYFGGIYGAGLAAKYYNERLFESYAQKIHQRECFFPLFMLRYSF